MLLLLRFVSISMTDWKDKEMYLVRKRTQLVQKQLVLMLFMFLQVVYFLTHLIPLVILILM